MASLARQWLSLLGFSYGFKKQSLEKLFVTVGKKSQESRP